ncbi:MAG: hypothetical protein ACFFBP_11510 [Promethearchaeota archaeon]
MPFSIDINKEKNRVLLSLSGIIQKSEEEDMIKQIQNVDIELKRKYSILLDLRDFKMMEDLPYMINKISKTFKHLRYSALIVPHSYIGNNQIQTLLVKTNHKVENHFCVDLNEANLWLDSL